MMTNEEAIEILKGIMDDDTDHHIAWACGASDAFEMAISALEKQVSKKPEYEEEDRFVKNHFTWYAYCPQCGCEINTGDMHCTQCGQAIDWSDET